MSVRRSFFKIALLVVLVLVLDFSIARTRRRTILFSRQPHGGQGGGEDGNSTADDIRQHRHMKIKRRREQRADDARQGAGALGDADGCALLVGGREIGEQSKQRRTREAGADGQQREDEQHFNPRAIRRVQHRRPFQRAVALDERQQREGAAGEQQAYGNQFWLAEYFHQPADQSALDERADDPAENEQ